MSRSSLPLLVLLAWLPACDPAPLAAADPEASTAHQHGQNGGHVLPLGTSAQVEFVHRVARGEVRVFVLGTDGKTPLPIPDAPVLKLATPSGPRLLTLTPEGPLPAASFRGSDPLFEAEHLEGVLAITVAGLPFSKDLEGFHDH